MCLFDHSLQGVMFVCHAIAFCTYTEYFFNLLTYENVWTYLFCVGGRDIGRKQYSSLQMLNLISKPKLWMWKVPGSHHCSKSLLSNIILSFVAVYSALSVSPPHKFLHPMYQTCRGQESLWGFPLQLYKENNSFFCDCPFIYILYTFTGYNNWLK